MRRETAGEQTGKRVDVNYRQLKQAASEATHEPLPYVSASRQGVRVHPPHAALACRSGPKGCLLFIGSIFTRAAYPPEPANWPMVVPCAALREASPYLLPA